MFLVYMSELEYVQHSVDDARLAVNQCNMAWIRIRGCQTTLLDGIGGTDSFGVMLNFFTYSRFGVQRRFCVCGRLG